jgi:putative peptide zinc metalloprotease protein
MTTDQLTDSPPERPRMAPNVLVHEPAEPGGHWIIQTGSHRYYRVQPDLARLARAIDGQHDHAALAELLGPPWTPREVAVAVDTLHRRRLLDDGTAAEPPRTRRFRFVPPLTVQFTVLRPDRVLARLVPVLRVLLSRPGRLLGAAIGLGGLGSLLTHGSDVRAALGSPLPLGTYVGLFVAMIATTALHEVGHGVVLSSHGGRPSRMGVMLFYLSPAFFCDVSDGWRLPRRAQRVQVALAGAGVQFLIAGGAALAAPLVTDPPTRLGLFAFAVMTLISGVLNLIPLIKLDGYIALMSHLDIPHLRDRATADARGLLGHLMFGGRRPPRSLADRRWATGYGLACLAFPIYVVATALTLWVDLLRRTGTIGAVVALCALGYLAYRLVVGYTALVRQARDGGARALRVAVATTLLAGALIAGATWIRLPYLVSGGYTVAADGRVRLVLPPSADLTAVHDGDPVTLYRAGLVLREQVGTAVVQDAEPVPGRAPTAALAPVTSGSAEVPVVSYPLDYPLDVPNRPADDAGAATIHAGDRTLAGWLYATYVAPTWRR